MILYHGTNQIIQGIDLNKGRNRTDFGKGFYLGSNLDVAREWAKARAVFSGAPIVMRYDLDVANAEYQKLLNNDEWSEWNKI